MSDAIARLCLSEHAVLVHSDDLNEAQSQAIEEALIAEVAGGPTLFSNHTQSFTLEGCESTWSLKTDYLIGADWLLTGRSYVQVIPKVDRALAEQYIAKLDNDASEVTGGAPIGEASSRNNVHFSDDSKRPAPQVHYLKMLMTIASDSVFDGYMEGLFHIDYTAPPLPLPSDEDYLTPLLVVRFIQVLRRLVSKGLRKTYHPVTTNLTNRVKGKVLVSRQIRENVLKTRPFAVFCRYDSFSENTLENQFLKRSFRFARRYLETHEKLFGDMAQDLRCEMRQIASAFERVDELSDVTLLKHTSHHPFYGEYQEAVRVGKLLLKRFGYAFNAIETDDLVSTPPFWINMPALFEMYVCAMMRAHNPEAVDAIHYQFSLNGNQIDILLGSDSHRIVIDTKYKMRYQNSHIHQDIRQVAGYARLKKVRQKLGLPDEAEEAVDCLIIYPDVDNGIEDFTIETMWRAKRSVVPYHKVWKLGVKVPVRTSAAEPSTFSSRL